MNEYTQQSIDLITPGAAPVAIATAPGDPRRILVKKSTLKERTDPRGPTSDAYVITWFMGKTGQWMLDEPSMPFDSIGDCIAVWRRMLQAGKL